MHRRSLAQMLRAHGKLPALAGLLCVAFAGGAGVSAMAQQGAALPAGSVFQNEASKLGVRKCAALFTALGQTVTQGSTYTVHTNADREAPDARGVHAVAGMTYNAADFRGQAAAVVLAAPVGQGCEGQLVRIAPYQRTCQQVVAMLPAGSTAGGNLSGVPLYNLGGNQGQALLVPNGSACVVVTVAQGKQQIR